MKYATVAAVLLLTACAGQVGDTLAAKTAVQYGVLKYIGDDVDRAQGVHNTVARISGAVDDTETRVEIIKSAVLAQINFAALDLADQLVVRNLVDAIAAEIEARQGDGRLDGNTIVAVRAVLAWAREAALIAGATPCSAVLGNC